MGHDGKEKVGISAIEWERVKEKECRENEREGGNKHHLKKLKISSVLRHSLGHMVTSIYHIRSQFLTRWGHISRDSSGYNHSPLKIQWIDGRNREGEEGSKEGRGRTGGSIVQGAKRSRMERCAHWLLRLAWPKGNDRNILGS